MKITHCLAAFLLLPAVLLTSCDDSSRIYARQLKAEKLLIEDYIERNGLKIVDRMPSDEAFLRDKKLYYHSPNGLYYRLEREGRSDLDSIESGDKLTVGIKYLEYTLSEPADTVDCWSPEVYPYWREFAYGNTSSSSALGVLEAVGYMRKTDAEASLILTTKLGFNPIDPNVVPHGYRMKIRFTKNTLPE